MTVNTEICHTNHVRDCNIVGRNAEQICTEEHDTGELQFNDILPFIRSCYFVHFFEKCVKLSMKRLNLKKTPPFAKIKKRKSVLLQTTIATKCAHQSRRKLAHFRKSQNQRWFPILLVN